MAEDELRRRRVGTVSDAVSVFPESLPVTVYEPADGGGAGRAGARAVRADRERRRARDVAAAVVELVEALRRVGLRTAGRDRRRVRADRDVASAAGETVTDSVLL